MFIGAYLKREKGYPCAVWLNEPIFRLEVIIESAKDNVRIDSKALSDAHNINWHEDFGAASRVAWRKRAEARIIAFVDFL